MASDLLSIASSGARVARSALDVTAQNIANAASDGYVRRTLQIEEVSAAGGPGRIGDLSLSGAQIADIQRNADSFRQAEVRRTSADLERANVELGGLRNIETAIEQSGIFTAIIEFEASLLELAGDPVDPARRAAVIGEAQTIAGTFNIANSSFDAIADGLQVGATSEVDESNVLAAELARVNLGLIRASKGTSDKATLLDQRDLLLEKLASITAVTTQFEDTGAVAVSVGTNPPRALVQGGDSWQMTSAIAADGTMSFAVDGQALDPGSGSLTGASLALVELASARTRLDTIATDFADAVNNAQAAGVDLNGGQGQPVFAGNTAATLQAVMTDGAGLATAPAGAAAGSRDDTNLSALRLSLTTLGPAEQMNGLIFDISSKVAGRDVTQSALETIASSARIALESQTGVDLDQEAANLIRYQQAFQASGRAMQVATEVFNTLIGIGR